MNWLCVFQEGRCSCTPHGLILSTRSKIRKTIRILQYTIRATGANTITYETDKPCTLQVTPNQIELEVISSLDQCSPVKNPSTASQELRECDGEDASQTSWNNLIMNHRSFPVREENSPRTCWQCLCCWRNLCQVNRRWAENSSGGGN